MSSPGPSPAPQGRVDLSQPEHLTGHTGLDATPPVGPGLTGPFVPPPRPTAPPGYEMLEEIGRGGMGAVWRAHDLRLNREVAVKLIQERYIGDHAAAERFLAEATITGQLQHPGIPAVHELGTLPDGRPFLAMKLVKGQTLHELLKERSSPSQERGRFIAIFEQVCHAVGYAHAHKVIHRDLKPSNVMVGAHGEVQVMDWGLAKVLTDPASPERERRGDDPNATVGLATKIETPERDSSATRTGSVLGTPSYMPPEQAGGEIHKLDARSDVFGLGAMLCQILTGRPPYRGVNANEIRLQAVRGEMAEAFAALDSCGAEPELIALCKRCLAREQTDRPADGRAVAAEVAAIRQAAEERARRAQLERAEALVRAAEQRRRRRQLLVAAAVVLVTLSAGLAVSIWQMNRAIDAEQQATANADLAQTNAEKAIANAEKERLARLEAQEQRRQADANRQRAEEAKATAERNLAFAKKGNEILGSVFAGLDPKKIAQSGRPLQDVLRENLVTAVKQLEGSAIGEPLEVAQMQNTLGLSLLGLGEAKLAIEVLQKALTTRQTQLGPDHPDTLISMNNLASGYRAAGQLAKALPLYEETLKLTKAKLGPDHPDTLTSMNNLASGYRAAGQLDRALPLYEETLKLRKAKLGPDHPDTLISMNNLASGYQDAGQLDRALPLYEETLKLTKAKLGPDHPDTLQSMNNLASGYQDARQLDRALPLYEETLKLRKAKLGPDHPDTLTSMNNLASGYQDARQLDRALPLYEETLKLRKAKLGPDHPDTLTSMNNLASGYQDAGQLDRALPLYEETLKLRKAKLGPDHPDTLTSMNNLASGYQDAGQLDRALPLYEETLKLRKAKLGPDHPDTLTSMGNLGKAYCDARQGEKAAPLLKEFVAGQRKRFPRDDPRFAGLLAQVSLELLRCDQFSTAEEMLRECLAIQEQKEPEAWTTFNTLSMLGGALLGQKKYAQAEPLLVKGYEGMKARAKTIPAQGKDRIFEAIDRLIALYTAMGKPDEVTKWQTEKEKLLQRKEPTKSKD